jgi:hypothetical protein
MRKTIITILGMLLIAGSANQMAAASEHNGRNVYREPMAVSQQFRNANGSAEHTSCGNQPGNPYNKDTDYTGWSAWRAEGGWDSRNDCR